MFQRCRISSRRVGGGADGAPLNGACRGADAAIQPNTMADPLLANPQLVPRYAGIAALVLLAIVILEALLRRYVWRRPTDLRGVAASLGDALVRRGVELLGLTAAAPLPALAWAHRLATIRMDSATAWLGLYLLVEFAYYWHHRLTHRVRWFWASHSVHHSSNQLMLASAVRLGWTGRLGGAIAFFTPLVWLGFSPPAVVGLLAGRLVYQFWVPAH